VDIMSRWEGPVAQHVQYLFVSDWLAEGGDDISGSLRASGATSSGSVLAQVVGTGPTSSFDAMPACFSELIHSARDDLVITTPYFVPDEQLLFAITSAARRGVKTTMIVPKRCDSWIVGAASRSYYEDLLKAGVDLFEYRPGMLHSKTIVVDGKIGLIGSANLDRRSFELNFENNILFADTDFATAVRKRQDSYRANSDQVTGETVARVSLPRRIWRLEEEVDLDPGVLVAVRTVNRIGFDRFRIGLADRPLVGLRRVGRAHHLPVAQHGVFALEDLNDHGP
jgi:cardiolipin synthase